jgi:hypothetical protein
MPNIRIPTIAESLLSFCSRNQPAAENACFDTYASLLAFAAAYGFQSLNGQKPRQPAESEFIKGVYPVELDIFKNQHLFPHLLLIGLAADGSQAIARDEERLCKLIEAYAQEGCVQLAAELAKSTAASFHLDLARLLEQAAMEFPNAPDPKH